MQETFYRMLVHIDYYKGEEIREVPSLALEATIPNSRVMGGGTSVEAFFRTNSQFDLVRTVGKRNAPRYNRNKSFLSSVDVTKRT